MDVGGGLCLGFENAPCYKGGGKKTRVTRIKGEHQVLLETPRGYPVGLRS